jgi:hypothetical protein
MLDAAPLVRSSAIRQPLTLGELLDRAVTLIVRRLALWLGLFAAVALPLTVCSHVALVDLVTRNRFATVDVVPLAIVQGASLLVGYPLVIACAIFLVDRACEAAPFSVRAGFARAIRRLLSIYAVVVLWSFASSLVSSAISLTLVGLASAAPILPHGNDFFDWVGIVAGAILTLSVLFGVLPIVVMLCAVAICYAVVETQNPFVALQRAFVRIVRKGELVRAAIVGDVVLLVAASATGIAAGFGEPLDELLHAPVGSAALGFLASIVATVVSCTFVALYARDARMRRDGGDLVYAALATVSPRETVPGHATSQ